GAPGADARARGCRRCAPRRYVRGDARRDSAPRARRRRARPRHRRDAPAHAALTRNAGNIALLGTAGELRLVDAARAAAVADAYREYRRLQHTQRMAGAAQARVAPAPQAARRAEVE